MFDQPAPLRLLVMKLESFTRSVVLCEIQGMSFPCDRTCATS